MTGGSGSFISRRHRYGEHQDYYPTPAPATRVLTRWLHDNGGLPSGVQAIWECAAGEGHMVDTLVEAGLGVHRGVHDDAGRPQVVGTDLVHRGRPDIKSLDFLADTDLHARLHELAVITNPPFSLAERFARRALEGGAPFVALLCNMAFLGGKQRAECLFRPWPFHRLLVIPKRVSYAMGGGTEPAKSPPFTSAWFVWRRGSADQRIEFRDLDDRI